MLAGRSRAAATDEERAWAARDCPVPPNRLPGVDVIQQSAHVVVPRQQRLGPNALVVPEAVAEVVKPADRVLDRLAPPVRACGKAPARSGHNVVLYVLDTR